MKICYWSYLLLVGLVTNFLLYRIVNTILTSNLLISVEESPNPIEIKFYDPKDPVLSQIVGVEDLEGFVSDTGANYLFGTADKYRALTQGPILGARSESTEQQIKKTPGNGVVWAMTDSGSLKEKFSILPIKSEYPKYFHPHGFGLFPSQFAPKAEKPKLFFAVNHMPYGDEIVVFEIVYEDIQGTAVPTSLVTRHVVSHSLFRNLNDVTPISETEFLVTNWMYFPQGTWASTFEILGQLPWNDVVYCKFLENPGFWECRVVADQLSQPNGINYYPDTNQVILVEGLSKLVHFFTLDRNSEKILQHVKAVPTRSVCDNISRFKPSNSAQKSKSSEFDIFAGCHVYALSFTDYAGAVHKAHGGTVEKKSAGEVILFSENGSSTSFLVPDFNKVKGLSVAQRIGDKVYMGTVFEPGVFVATIKE